MPGLACTNDNSSTSDLISPSKVEIRQFISGSKLDVFSCNQAPASCLIHITSCTHLGENLLETGTSTGIEPYTLFEDLRWSFLDRIRVPGQPRGFFLPVRIGESEIDVLVYPHILSGPKAIRKVAFLRQKGTHFQNSLNRIFPIVLEILAKQKVFSCQ